MTSRRLTHSFSAWLRSHQTSTTQLYIYVEGKNSDRAYYERVLRSTLSASGIRYLFELSRNIPVQGEGKAALIAAFESARGANLLRNSFQSKKTALLFFVDKDVDDILRTKKRSSSLQYTEHYCIENHIIAESSIARAIALAASADPSVVSYAIGDEEQWRRDRVALQKEWLAVCILAKKMGISIKNYGAHWSPINPATLGPTDSGLLSSYLSTMHGRTSMTRTEFDLAFGKSLALVARYLNQYRDDEIFKGKWYGPFLEDAAASIVGPQNLNVTTFRHSIWTALVAELNPMSNGSNRFRASTDAAIAWLAS